MKLTHAISRTVTERENYAFSCKSAMGEAMIYAGFAFSSNTKHFDSHLSYAYIMCITEHVRYGHVLSKTEKLENLM